MEFEEIMLINNDCLIELAKMQDCSIDSLITDPPAGISFMNKEWDKPTDFIKDMTAIYKECLRVLKPGAHGLVWGMPRTSHWTATALEQAGFEIRDVITHLFGSGFPKSLDVSKAIKKLSEHTLIYYEELSNWKGWGTALKPASEHWILVRKPLSESTIAKNVLEHGTGGINIDASRIAHTGSEDLTTKQVRTKIQGGGYGSGQGKVDENPIQTYKANGRFPANLVLSHNEDCDDECTEGCAVKMLDEQSGITKSAPQKRTPRKIYQGNSLNEAETLNLAGLKEGGGNFSDTGGASRFFYCAKASKRDRGEDNVHPTVKSTKLMEYLIRLITPPQGVVLDPFMGSGSTGVAAKRLGFEFVGIEREKEYYEIAEQRIQ